MPAMMEVQAVSRNLSYNSQVIAATAEDQNGKSNWFTEIKEDPRTRMINKVPAIFHFLETARSIETAISTWIAGHPRTNGAAPSVTGHRLVRISPRRRWGRPIGVTRATQPVAEII